MKFPMSLVSSTFFAAIKNRRGSWKKGSFQALTSLHLFVPISRDDDESGEEQREGERRGGDRLDYVQQVD